MIYTKISFWNFPTFKDPVQYAKKLEKQTADRLANGVWDPMKPTDIVLDVYKHVEFQHLEISIEPKTFRIFEGRKDLEAWFQRDNLDIKQLIEDGILFKVLMCNGCPLESDFLRLQLLILNLIQFPCAVSSNF